MSSLGRSSSPRFTAQARWSLNDVELAEGAFTTHLLTTRASYSFSPSMFVNALIQYNSITDELSNNVRFNIIHRPLSDIFVVYNDLRDDQGRVVDRALVAKFTYLFDF